MGIQGAQLFDIVGYEEKILFTTRNGAHCAFAYERLGRHLKAAVTQMERICSFLASMPQEPEPSLDGNGFSVEAYEWMKRQKALYEEVLIDIHFYFVAWANVRNVMAFLAKQPEFLEANKIYNAHKKTLEHYVDGRNGFEHYHDTLSGYKRRKKLSKPEVGFSLQGGHYGVANKRWDITPTSTQQLLTIAQEFLIAIHQSVDERINQLQAK